jgi:glutamate carboxypeptidase
MNGQFDSAKLSEIRNFFERRESEIIDSICRLARAESPSGDIEGNRAVVDLLEKIAADIPAIDSIERIEKPVYGEHLRIRAFGESAGEQTTLLVGHTDTVYPRGTTDAQPVRIEGECLYGPGVFDMKASCIVALEVLRCLDALKVIPPRPVVLLLTCDEEVGSATGRPLVEEEANRAAQVLVLEPSAPGGKAKTARKGVGSWTITAEGIASHAGLNPKAGASAILELARQTERFHRMNDAADAETGDTSFNVGMFRGGTGGNVVAAHAEMILDARFASTSEAERISDFVSNLQPFDDRVRLTVRGGNNLPPLERTAGVVGLYHKARRIAAQLDFELGECAVGGASDGNFAAALGVPVLDGLGIEGDGAHAAHEHILITDIRRRGALLAALVATL